MIVGAMLNFGVWIGSHLLTDTAKTLSVVASTEVHTVGLEHGRFARLCSEQDQFLAKWS